MPERERLGHLRVGSVGPDQITRVAHAIEMIAVADFRCARERRAARKFDSRLLCLAGEPANDVGRIGREKVVAGCVEIDVAHVGRVKPDARHLPDEFRGQGIEEGDLIDDLFDDDSRGMQPLARIVLPFQHAHAQAAASKHGGTRQPGEARADDRAICGGRIGRAGQDEARWKGRSAQTRRYAIVRTRISDAWFAR